MVVHPHVQSRLAISLMAEVQVPKIHAIV
jgi:hypothetical protein